MSSSTTDNTTVSPVRSRNMSAIRSKNTRPEMVVRKALHSLGFRYRLHVKDLAGKPDLVLKKYHLAVFIHGCFWHRHQHCFYTSTPATRKEFWQQKFIQNQQRDRLNQQKLLNNGWRVLIVWECGLRSPSPCFNDLVSIIQSTEQLIEWPAQPYRKSDGL